MAIEQNFKTFRQDKNKIIGSKNEGNVLYNYEESIDVLREELKSSLVDDLEQKILSSEKSETVIKNKAYLRNKEDESRERIAEIVYSKNLRVRGFDNPQEYIDEMVDEFAGYSILADAFRDDEVSDIFCITWEKIYIEKNGKNIKYPKKFRSPKHYKDFVDKLLREAGKEMNNGENKIVDFDLYEDRYCATSKAVSPKDISLTIRKHSEDHIKLKQIIDSGVMSQKVADLLGTFILGELNLIIAGITGSGKTTSMRALLDYYVTKANKRMIVCEDTQELFPENDHTLELVTSKGESRSSTITLGDLVTASLRLKPKTTVIGEVRSVEAESAVEGMSTGHSTIFSMHAGLPIDAINRLVTKYITAMPTLGVDVVERIIGNALDYIAIQDDIPDTGRKITSITEVSYDYDTRRISLKPIVKFDFRTNEFKFINKISPDKAEKMLRRGIKYDDLKPIVEGWDEIVA